MTSARGIASVLLVEDNMGDADLVREYLDETDGRDGLQIVHAMTLSAATEKLKEFSPDIVLLDLRLPDGVGAENVEAITRAVPGVPIVVLTGLEDEALALECIDAGAQDYLCKMDIHAKSLRRTMGFAVARARKLADEGLRALREASTPPAGTEDQSDAAFNPLRERSPDDFDRIVEHYCGIMRSYVERISARSGEARPDLNGLIRVLTDVGAGARDLVEVHTRAVERLTVDRAREGTSPGAIEGRYMALELMVLLAEQYRMSANRAN